VDKEYYVIWNCIPKWGGKGMLKRNWLVGILLVLGLVLTACGGSEETSSGEKQEPKPKDVIAAFEDAGLEVGETSEMGKDDYGMAPLGDEGIRFLIPSLGEDAGGRVIYYEDKEYLNKAKDYYVDLGKESAMLFSHVFTNGNIIVQINGDLDESKAKEYEKSLKGN
jgi:hypothetical protein